MNLRKTVIAISLAAISCSINLAQAESLMAEFKGPSSPQESHGMIQSMVAKNQAAGLSEQHGFSLQGQHPGAEGTRISRLQHTYEGIPVFGSESVLVHDAGGKLVSEVHSERRQGLGVQTAASLAAHRDDEVPGLAKQSGPISTSPSLSAQQVINSVVRSVAPNGVHETPPHAELIVYPVTKRVRVPGAENKADSELNAFDVKDVVIGHELAYLVETRMVKNGQLQFRDTIVNAHSGKVIKQWNSMHSVAGTGKSQYSGTVKVETTLSGGVYKMLDTTRGTGGVFGGMAITNLNKGSGLPGTIYTDSDNIWGDGLNYKSTSSTTSANGQTAAVEAMWGFRNTYDMLKNVLGWKSLDGKNTASYIGVHFMNAEDNAYYDKNCKCMKIGDGATMFKQLGSIDVIGHEMGHGITDATSRLIYSGESGGLNESASDITGEMVEAYAKSGGIGNVIPATGNDWMTGKEISLSGTPLRWMYKPSKDGASLDAWSTSLASMNPHYSSGPANRMFYFLAKGSSSSSTSEYYSKYLTKAPLAMVGIGNDKAYRIWFKALTTKMTASTTYAQAQAACVQAATELYGATSKEVIAVKRAFAAINVGPDVAG